MVLIGNEIPGYRIDKYGHPRDEINGEIFEKFEKQSRCLIKQYSEYSFDGKRVNGTPVLDENIADAGGIKAAYYAYQASKDETSKEQDISGLNLTSDQLFFISYAQVQKLYFK